jgi:next-to-BRCA1 protein 1
MKVHSSDDYNNCIAPYQHTPWQHALLKFSVFDNDIAHTTPGVSASDRFQPRISTAPVGARPLWRPFTNSMPGNASTNSSMLSDSRPVSFCHIPPPPVIFSAASPSANVNQVFPDMSSQTATNSIFDTHPPAGTPPVWENKQKQATSTASSCCDISQTKLEVERLITTFKRDLDNVLTSTFGSSPASLPSFVPPVIPGATPLTRVKSPYLTPVLHFQYWCVACTKPLLGSWLACQLCPYHVIVCQLTKFTRYARF